MLDVAIIGCGVVGAAAAYSNCWHPANEEEAVARIEAIEAEYERIARLQILKNL